MEIRDERLTIGPALSVRGWPSEKAEITITFRVVLLPQDLQLPGGFLEEVDLEPNLGTHRRTLPIDEATKPRPGVDWKELSREHTFQVPRYPEGPFMTVKVHG